MYPRHIKASALRGMFEDNPYWDLSFLSDDQYDLVIILSYFAGKRINLNMNYGLCGIHAIGLDGKGEDIYNASLDNGFIRQNEYIDALNDATIPEIKTLLDKCSIPYKKSSNKETLIDLVLRNVKLENEMVFLYDHLRWIPTKYGLNLIGAYYREMATFMLFSLKAFMCGDISSAHLIHQIFRTRNSKEELERYTKTPEYLIYKQYARDQEKIEVAFMETCSLYECDFLDIQTLEALSNRSKDSYIRFIEENKSKNTEQ